MLENEIYHAFARYNRWMNGKLLTACALLSDEERKRPMGVPFRSIHGLWNHLLLTDRMWLCRFENLPVPPYKTLDEEICSDFEELRREREKTDDAIDALVAELTAERLASHLTFTSLSIPRQRTLPFYVGVSQLFNHQTHHRGQITAVLEQLGGDCGSTDFAAMPELEIQIAE